MALYFRYHYRDIPNYYPIELFSNLQNKLKNKYDIQYMDIDPTTSRFGQSSIFSCMHMSILNSENNKYIVISLFDHWRAHFLKYLGWEPELMTQLLYGAGFNFKDYFNFKYIYRNNKHVHCPSDIKDRYNQFYYHTYYSNYDDLENKFYTNRNHYHTIPKLFFRGYLWDFRKLMVEYLIDDDIKIIDKNTDNNNYSYIHYLKELSEYRCALSLPGGSEICNRDIECFAIGVPVIRPTILTNYPDPLIPGYHYIDCNQSAIYLEGKPKFNNYQDFAQNILQSWNIVKNNIEYLNFISNNARNWYIKNCTLKNNCEYILSKIDINSLF